MLSAPSLALFTDLYELTMGQAYWESGRTAPAHFSLFFRSYPPDRGYFVFAGLADVLDYLEQFHFSDDDIAYLQSLKLLRHEFLDYLRGLRFTGSVRAMLEGTIFFTNEPVMEVHGPVIEAQLFETYLLNQVHLQTVLATKASRIVHAAAGKPVIDFGARRTHGTDADDKLARVSYLVGFDGSSNCVAGARYGIPVSGTMAHSYIMSFESETEAFRSYARAFPDSSTFLVDSYDTIEGIRRAIAVAHEMKAQGHRLHAVRLDSGDLLDLSRIARAMLDVAGLQEVEVLASGGLDEFEIDRLVRAGAPIDVYAVGTKLGVSADAPWSDCVYKLVDYGGRPVLKASTGKSTLPGPKSVFRFRDSDGTYDHDVISVADEPIGGAEPLLEEVMSGGKRVSFAPGLGESRDRFRREFAFLADRCKRLKSPDRFEVLISDRLAELRDRITRGTS
jgi:nicotinate phosphoribosyltransferase